MRRCEAVTCSRCHAVAYYPDDATTWIKRAEYMDRLIADGWTVEVFRQLCPECSKGGEQ